MCGIFNLPSFLNNFNLNYWFLFHEINVWFPGSCLNNFPLLFYSQEFGVQICSVVSMDGLCDFSELYRSKLKKSCDIVNYIYLVYVTIFWLKAHTTLKSQKWYFVPQSVFHSEKMSGGWQPLHIYFNSRCELVTEKTKIRMLNWLPMANSIIRHAYLMKST
jgi:hypothetical protein